jgi:2'-5' RNA ligase
MPESSARMFFALAIDRALDGALDAHAAALVAATGGRAVPATNRHATLAFIGTVPRTDIVRLTTIGAGLPRTPFDLALDTIGTFKGAHVAWIGPSGIPAELVSLHGILAAQLFEQRFPVDERPYHAHVTLARHCRRTLPQRGVAPLAWPVREVVLYESITAPQGPRYEPRAHWPLSA